MSSRAGAGAGTEWNEDGDVEGAVAVAAAVDDAVDGAVVCLGCAELHPGVVRRVKVYTLDEEETWKDQGTGQVQLHQLCPRNASTEHSCTSSHIDCIAHSHSPKVELDIAEEGEGEESCLGCPSLLLLVWAESAEGSISGPSSSTPAPLLSHRVSSSVAYSLQAETILSWTDAKTGRDWALSFQDSHRCHDVLQAIVDHQANTARAHSQHSQTTAQQRNPRSRPPHPLRSDDEEAEAHSEREWAAPASVNADANDSAQSKTQHSPVAAVAESPSLASPGPSSTSTSSSSSPASSDDSVAALRSFPLPSLDSLDLLHQRLQDSQADPQLRQAILTATTASGSPWLSSLFALCGALETEQDVDALQSLFALLIALMNAVHDEQLLERLFDSNHALHSFSVLEYDPAIIARLREANELRLPLRRHSAALQSARCHWVLPSSPSPSSSVEWASVERCLHFHYRLQYAKSAHTNKRTQRSLASSPSAAPQTPLPNTALLCCAVLCCMLSQQGHPLSHHTAELPLSCTLRALGGSSLTQCSLASLLFLSVSVLSGRGASASSGRRCVCHVHVDCVHLQADHRTANTRGYQPRASTHASHAP